MIFSKIPEKYATNEIYTLYISTGELMSFFGGSISVESNVKMVMILAVLMAIFGQARLDQELKALC